MKVLVTGANGFLGNHVVRTLIDAGYKVKAFVLRGTSRNTLEDFSCEIIEGNLLNDEDIEHALEACDYVIHTAGITDVYPSRNELSWIINFELVKKLAKIVQTKSITKFIHVGTANSFGFGTIAKPGTERSVFNGSVYGLDYIDSKKAAQDYLLNEAKKHNLPVVIINPTFMIGEGDSKPGSGEMIISVAKGEIPGYSDGGRCFAAVKDVAEACVSAIEKGRIGECYIAGGTNLSYKDFFTMVAKMTGIKPPRLRISKNMAVFFARLMTLVAYIRKKKPKLTVSMARVSNDGHYYSSDKAIKELGYTMTSLEQALSEAIEWYRENGYLFQKRYKESEERM